MEKKLEKKFNNLMQEWNEFQNKGGTGEEFILKKGIESIIQDSYNIYEKEINFFLEIDEVELTDKLINRLVEEKKWGNVESLYEARKKGAKWNNVRNSLVFPAEFI